MTIFITGGSNSVRTQGWSYQFADLVRATPGRLEEPIVNLAVGATSSITSAFRTIFTADVQKGDTIVWEYALNDSIYFSSTGYPVEVLLRHCEHLIVHARERGAQFVPLVFRRRSDERRPQPNKYLRRLFRMFETYGLEYFDASTEVRAQLGVDVLDASHYEDPNHYKYDGPVCREAAVRGVEIMEKQQNWVKKRNPLYIPEGCTLQLAELETDLEYKLYKNRMMQLDSHIPSLPFSFKPFDYTGRLSGIFALIGRDGGGFELRMGDHVQPISLQLDSAQPQKMMFWLSGLAGLTEDGMTFAPGDQLSFHQAQPEAEFMADQVFTGEVPAELLPSPAFQLVAVMTEKLA